MDGLQFVSALVASLAWPVVVLIIAILFRDRIKELLGRIRTVKAFGAEGTFDPKEAETKVALAKATSVGLDGMGAAGGEDSGWRPLTFRLNAIAAADPRAAVLQAYEEVERTLRTRMSAQGLGGVEGLADYDLANVALQMGVISQETAAALRDVVVQRNLAAHDRDVDSSKALEYLHLCDELIVAIEAWRGSQP